MHVEVALLRQARSLRICLEHLQRKAAALLVLLAAEPWIWTLSTAKPSTDDASIDVEVVHIAALVGGRIIELLRQFPGNKQHGGQDCCAVVWFHSAARRNIRF